MLTTTSEHAIRALVCLAQAPHDRPVLLRELADLARVPESYLSKILGTLTRIGILSAARGVNGGYRLRRSPKEIALLEVIETFDGPQREQMCIFSKLHPCSDDDPCPVHRDWKRVRAVYLGFLEEKRLDDLVGPAPKNGGGSKGGTTEKAAGRDAGNRRRERPKKPAAKKRTARAAGGGNRK